MSPLLVAARLGLTLAVAASGAPPALPALTSDFLFNVSSATGAVPSTWATLAYDAQRDELFVAHGGLVRIFNRLGMEVYSFGADGDLGYVTNVAVVEDGSLFVLSSMEGMRVVTRCNFKGDRVETLALKGLPAAFAAPFNPDAMVYRGGKLYLAETGRLRVLVVDMGGQVQASYALADILRLDAKTRREAALGGFSVNAEGNLLFTIPTLFTAFVVSPRGEIVRVFGIRGSSPGKFNIAGKLVNDDRGYHYVLDKLRSVVMVFDPDARFLGEFGYRGDDPSNLAAPYDLAVGNGKVFVSQAQNRGVSVFKVSIQ